VPEFLCVDWLLVEERFAYFPVESERYHAHVLESFVLDGEEVILGTRDGDTLRLSYWYKPEHKQAVESWNAVKNGAAIMADLARAVESP
jgi:hypothetical protein